jgi:Flp pilus assembly protein TadD
VGTTHNHLGYALLEHGKKDEAIAAFKKYAELSPTEPNPHDSLADALLAANKLEEAEASYLKATEVAPAFAFAWNGVAATRALRGNWAGAEEALAKYREAAATPEDKMHAAIDLAWYQFAQNKSKAALKTIDEVEKQAQTDKVDMIYATAPLHRAAMFIDTNKAKDAIKLTATALERAEKAALPGDLMSSVRGFALHVRALAEWKLNKKDDLAKTAVAFDEEVKKNPGSAKLASALHDIQGLAAMAAGDAKTAVDHFGRCLEQDALCAYHRVEVEEKAGNKAGADAIRERVSATPARDAKYIYVRSKLGTIPST